MQASPRRISKIKTREKQTEKLQTFKEQQQKQNPKPTFCWLPLVLLALPFQIQQLSPWLLWEGQVTSGKFFTGRSIRLKKQDNLFCTIHFSLKKIVEIERSPLKVSTLTYS